MKLRPPSERGPWCWPRRSCRPLPGPKAKCFWVWTFSPSRAAKPVPPVCSSITSFSLIRCPLKTPSGLISFSHVSFSTTSPVPLRTTSLEEVPKVSRVRGSMCRPASPSGTGVNLTGISSLSLSFLPLAGHIVSRLGFSTTSLALGALYGIQNAFMVLARSSFSLMFITDAAPPTGLARCAASTSIAVLMLSTVCWEMPMWLARSNAMISAC
mmetsp:Transcript_38068/g.84779  ORF Transcript_38068/g.84779 Transcript_38068/m.84779 type:complete len:212 (+) Transcript_38068:549-1184(+)